MWLIAGLGNPGARYRKNRHNVGFMVVDRLAAAHGAPAFKEKLKSEWTRMALDGEDAVLLKPQTYMNVSGEAVQAACAFFKVAPARVVVVHDELDLAWKDVRVKVGGGAAGHNGVRSVIQHLGPDFVRVRIGIGRPRQGSVESWVLGDFDEAEGAELPDVLEQATLAVEAIVRDGPAAAQTRFNARPR